MTHEITTAKKAATGKGDIAGTRISCSCGFDTTTSLASDAQRIAAEHLAWAKAKKAAIRAAKKAEMDAGYWAPVFCNECGFGGDLCECSDEQADYQ